MPFALLLLWSRTLWGEMEVNVFFCCAPAKLPRECHSDFAFKSSKLFLTAVMQGVMHSKCLFDKFLSSGKNKSHICIGNSALLLGNDCEFTSYNWKDVEIPFKHFSMYDSISGKLFFLHGDAEICGKYTSETVLFKICKASTQIAWLPNSTAYGPWKCIKKVAWAAVTTPSLSL